MRCGEWSWAPDLCEGKREESTVDPGLAMESVVMEYAVMESA